MRHYVEVMQKLPGSDSDGEPYLPVLVFEAYADVEVKSGRQLYEIGEVVTSEVITCMMWYDPRANNDMFIKWEGKTFEIQHIKPDREKKAMLITARIDGNE
jgi:SPP1 family predicted phage head-tail adaptor